MDKLNAAGYEQLFALPEWTMRLEELEHVAGLGTYEAHVFRCNVAVCDIALSGGFTDRRSASEAVSKRLRAWLVGYESRPLAGDSGFQVL